MSLKYLKYSALCTVFLGTLQGRANAHETWDRFSAPTGQLGANLTFNEEQRYRAHAEMSYYTRGGGTTLHALGWTFGAGFKVADPIEIEVTLPVEGIVESGAGDQFGVGNLALGANFFTNFGAAMRFKVGGLIAFGPWNEDVTTPEGAAVFQAGVTLNGYQDLWLHLPGYVHLVAPVRIEIGDTVQLTGDGSLHVALPTTGDDSELFVVLAPGIGIWPTPKFGFGARMPFQFLTEDDAAQISLEPFVRFNVGEQGFLATRFTMHLDDDLGFSFDTNRAWGLHLAFGGAF